MLKVFWTRVWVVVGIYTGLMVLSILALLLPKSGNVVQVGDINDHLISLSQLFGGALVGAISVAIAARK